MFIRYVAILVVPLLYASEVTPDSNESVRLKPLIPIAGTNLFLNAPYKWHDRTRPGCFVTWFYDTYLAWSGLHKGVSLLCNEEDQERYNTRYADWVFEGTDNDWIAKWVLNRDSTAQYHEPLKVKNIGAAGSGSALQTWRTYGTWWVGVDVYTGTPDIDMWNVQTHPIDVNFLQLEVGYYYLAENHISDKNRSHIYLSYNNANGYPYSFVNTVKLEASMYNFVFTEPLKKVVELHTSRKILFSLYIVENDSIAALGKTMTLYQKVTNQFSWGFSESLNTFSKVTGSVAIPYLSSTDVEADFEFEVAAHQNWTNSVEKYFEFDDVSLPQHVKISAWYDQIEDISIAYTATVKITGKTSRISEDNRMVHNSPASGEMIRKHLDSNFDGKILETGDETVIAQIKGTLVASVGVRGQFSIDGQIVKTCP